MRSHSNRGSSSQSKKTLRESILGSKCQFSLKFDIKVVQASPSVCPQWTACVGPQKSNRWMYGIAEATRTEPNWNWRCTQTWQHQRLHPPGHRLKRIQMFEGDREILKVTGKLWTTGQPKLFFAFIANPRHEKARG